MKTILMAAVAVLLSGCSATVVSYSKNNSGAECPPIVSVKTFGSSVVIADGAECKKEIEQ
jgi:PBP1b-binding outer membrane lipoprotein LpoB